MGKLFSLAGAPARGCTKLPFFGHFWLLKWTSGHKVLLGAEDCRGRGPQRKCSSREGGGWPASTFYGQVVLPSRRAGTRVHEVAVFWPFLAVEVDKRSQGASWSGRLQREGTAKKVLFEGGGRVACINILWRKLFSLAGAPAPGCTKLPFFGHFWLLKWTSGHKVLLGGEDCRGRGPQRKCSSREGGGWPASQHLAKLFSLAGAPARGCTKLPFFGHFWLLKWTSGHKVLLGAEDCRGRGPQRKCSSREGGGWPASATFCASCSPSQARRHQGARSCRFLAIFGC